MQRLVRREGLSVLETQEMKTPEGYEKDEIKLYLETIGAWYFCPYMAGFGKSGVPDIIACIDGMFFGIEVKRAGKAPTSRQALRMAEIEKSGGFAVAGTAEVVIAYLKTVIEPDTSNA
jgi:Holliday junction resolvase